MPIDGPQNPRRSYKQLKTENRFSPGPADQRNQATLRHPERSTYRCFLTDLAGFIDICRAGPDYADRQDRKKTGLFRPYYSLAEHGYCTTEAWKCQAWLWLSSKPISGAVVWVPTGLLPESQPSYTA